MMLKSWPCSNIWCSSWTINGQNSKTRTCYVLNHKGPKFILLNNVCSIQYSLFKVEFFKLRIVKCLNQQSNTTLVILSLEALCVAIPYFPIIDKQFKVIHLILVLLEASVLGIASLNQTQKYWFISNFIDM